MTSVEPPPMSKINAPAAAHRQRRTATAPAALPPGADDLQFDRSAPPVEQHLRMAARAASVATRAGARPSWR